MYIVKTTPQISKDMGNVLQQARNPHTDYHTGRYVYHPGSFMDQINNIHFRRTLMHTGHLPFDLTLEHVEDDRIVPKTVYRELLPKIQSITLYSEPSIPSLYNHTPNVLLYLAPKLQKMDMLDVNLIDLGAIEGMFPLLPGVTKVLLVWDHVRKLGERNHFFLDKVAQLEVSISRYDTVTVDSLVLLHEWASSNQRRLHVYVEHWTIAMQTVFMSACAVIQPLSDGLERFNVSVGTFEHKVFESTDPADVVWSRFVSRNTYGKIDLSVPGGTATQFTFEWLSRMLQIFMESSPHVIPSLELDCEEEGDWDTMKPRIDRLVLNCVERTRDAYMSAIDTTEFPTEVQDYDYNVYELKLAIRLPQTAMERITYTPPSATDLQTQPNYQDPTKIAFTIQLQTEMFHESKIQVLLNFELTRGTKRKHMA